MMAHQDLEALFRGRGLEQQWIRPEEIVVSQWVRMRCTFGCRSYGRNAACPPNVPSVSECRQFFDEYRTAVFFHFAKAVDKPEDRRQWSKQVNQSLPELEREVFLAGYQKAFVLFMDSCHMCAECSSSKDECRRPKLARPTPEAMAVDVFSTVRQYGYPIEVLTDYDQSMNRYAFLLIE